MSVRRPVPPLSVTLTREGILDGSIRALVNKYYNVTNLLTHEDVEASRKATIAEAPNGGAIWVFGYGSLIWNPLFHYAERRVGTAHGYHRRFCLWTEMGRGSADFPGLTLGLEYGGSCGGAVFRIDADGADTETKVVWHREMVGGAYRPRWIKVRTDGGPVYAVAFVINRDHPRYAGRLDDDAVADAIAGAQGPLGRCADYLLNTAAHLEDLGIADRRLNRLRDKVLARSA